MGNAILKSFRGECSDDSPPPQRPQNSGTYQEYVAPGLKGFNSPKSDLVTFQTTSQVLIFRDNKGFNSLENDLVTFQTTTQVPEGLGDHLPHSKKTQAKWYRKILAEWIGSDPRPRTPQEASNLIACTFTKDSTLARFLDFYNLPSARIPTNNWAPSKWPQGVQFEISTLPVNSELIGDGDGMTVHVDTSRVPTEIQEATIERRNCEAVGNYEKANKLERNIIKQGYRVIKGPNNEETLAKDYKIRLKGIDAPEMDMEYGKEAQDELIKLIQNKRLKIQIYKKDEFGRWLGDVYCNGVSIQKMLLKSGCAWHHVIYDDRPEFAKWEKEAKNAGRGLWANPHAVAPWVHKRENNNGRNSQWKYKSQKSMKKEQGVSKKEQGVQKSLKKYKAYQKSMKKEQGVPKKYEKRTRRTKKKMKEEQGVPKKYEKRTRRTKKKDERRTRRTKKV